MFKPESSTEYKNLQEIIDFRFKQMSADRLIEYITGMRLDDPEIGERLLTDRKIIREKYNFPQTRGELVDYERFLKDVAKKKGVLIRNTSDCGSFFDDHPEARGVYFRDSNQIGTDVDTATAESYGSNLITLEHELIHALQYKYYPRMPSEIREYEAYVAGISIEGIKKYFDDLKSPLLTLLAAPLLSSVYFSYKEDSEAKGYEIKPEWDSPYYFLEKVDKLDPVEIEDIRLSKTE